MTASESELEKARIRRAVCDLRRELAGRTSRSDRIMKRLLALPGLNVHHDACRKKESRLVVAGYAHVREEVETRSIIEYWLGHGQHKLALPYCLGRALRFVAIERWSDLQPGRFGVPEPAELFREDSTRMVAPEQCDVIIVPGVAFTRRGDRLGHGQGYYDRYLAVTRPDAMRIALAFECQLVDELPTEPHDYRVDVIVTEAAVCYCHG